MTSAFYHMMLYIAWTMPSQDVRLSIHHTPVFCRNGPIRIIVQMPEPDCFLQYRIGYGTLQPRLPVSCATTRKFTSGKSHIYVLAARF